MHNRACRHLEAMNVYFWLSFKPVLIVMASTDMIVLLLTQQVGHEFGNYLTHVEIIFQDDLNWLKWNSRHVRNFIGQIRSVYIHFLLCCSSLGIPSIWQLQQRLQHFLMWKTTQKLVFFPLSVLQKLLPMFENLCSTFPQFNTKFDSDTLFF